MEETLIKIIHEQQVMLAAYEEHTDTLYFVIYALLGLLFIYAAANLFFTYYIQIIDFIGKIWKILTMKN